MTSAICLYMLMLPRLLLVLSLGCVHTHREFTINSLSCTLSQVDVRLLKAAVEGDMPAMREVHSLFPRRLHFARYMVQLNCTGNLLANLCKHSYLQECCFFELFSLDCQLYILHSMAGLPFIWQHSMDMPRWQLK